MTESDFLRAILARPEDDTPRLQFADWLEEQGQEERAEFVRVQCALACRCDGNPPRYAACVSPAAFASHVSRAQEFLLIDTVFWGVDLPIPAAPVNGWCTWRRGFVSEVRCTLADWLQHGPAIVRQQPVERVEVTDRNPLDCPNGQSGWFTWTRPGDNTDFSELPFELFDKLPGAKSAVGFYRSSYYPTEPAARAALSDACLRWARGQPANEDALTS